MNKKILICAIIVIVILGIIFIPKILKNEGESEVKFKTLELSEAPKKIQELVPKYLYEERALACKVDNEIYIIVTRGEKRTEGYSVSLDKIVKVKNENNFDIIARAKYKDPQPNEMVGQRITYPVVVAKAELDKLPDKIKLEVEYDK
ncbi:protease complex subunit PrcB family protein [Proteiniborus sp. MB09-C3]|uniref:protease complex subunit PrcB family protein n=1 Tax=Proteiniborus sp. MB09-C3 TaxID=3050072 RepID=UPI0025574B3D|nr:protease complex subunit PrcB family protein [Proteiniborus sp. MB09-C3]WIV13469.1 protease complex subunit PrcB family protein [Proteiniborus sp. MB09-C3]